MGQPRLIGRLATNHYHVVSRVVDRRFIFGKAEKRHFRHLMRRLLVFSGLRCLTFCLMDNHFHLLLEVPDEEGEGFRERATAEDIFARLAGLYDPEALGAVRERYEEVLGAAGTCGERDAAAYLGTYLARMYDLSVFMKELKGRFTQWYNRREGREGTLWEARYRSVLCEGSSDVLLTMAAYIDLNPVRAGIVSDPKDYHWSGYGEAVAGQADARGGLVRLLGMRGGGSAHWRRVQSEYRMVLYGEGGEVTDGGSRVLRRGLTADAISEVVASGGKLSRAQSLRCQARFFTAGLALGGEEFIEEIFRVERWRFGLARKAGTKRMRGGAWGRLRVMRESRGGECVPQPPVGGRS